MTEAIPVPITSMIPVVLFPIFGIMTTIETVNCYMNDAVMVFIGGLILAFATEHCNLHMRIALIVMKIVGCSHTKLLGGLCTVTTFISMWIANAATTAMMVPIVFAVLYELERVSYLIILHSMWYRRSNSKLLLLLRTNEVIRRCRKSKYLYIFSLT